MATGPRASAILYQNPQADITLIDIPTSIATVQGSSDVPLSCQPREEPYPITNEPKSEKAKAKAKATNNTVDDELHIFYRAEIEKALAKIRSRILGPWCMPREIMNQVSKPNGNSEMDLDDPEEALSLQLRKWSRIAEEEEPDFQTLMTTLELNGDIDSATPSWVMAYHPSNRDLRENQKSKQEAVKEPLSTSFHNPENAPLDLTIFDSNPNSDTCFRFKIPARSTFYLQDCSVSDSFRAAFRSITDDHLIPRHFDFILLDPPWPNHSARRKAAYAPESSHKAMKEMILKMNLDIYLEHNGLIGIWITNSPAVRRIVLGEGGIFKKLNVGLIEEWIWVKTTKKGEPISALDSIWRKPYEVLLLGRAAPNPLVPMGPAAEVKRRVIVGVPDFHSRKPCLKELIEPYMPDKDDYTALEVFARNLVEGWSSWGDEVLKFQWEGYWAASGKISDGEST
ncbi:MT-A70-domain-containing protein [Delitschia confertaspora ATCC 74209]|uniref:MT-A70-domain-containing protein n=1 Tax=Delitschia confertaspora ATCC 74209 TaxID=1513339 RepID=A0A9P4JPV1_9PLEO|nr:MT-A70-domain-containing protein [Delitschia confertaspora ATCC 74209]